MIGRPINIPVRTHGIPISAGGIALYRSQPAYSHSYNAKVAITSIMGVKVSAEPRLDV
jgi:hypothetical protein